MMRIRSMLRIKKGRMQNSTYDDNNLTRYFFYRFREKYLDQKVFLNLQTIKAMLHGAIFLASKGAFPVKT